LGLFDYIRYEIPCPACGVKVSDFQSKDGPCLLETLEPHDVEHFYTSCKSCGQWIDVNVAVADPGGNCPHCGEKMPDKVHITVRPIDSARKYPVGLSLL